MTTTKELSEKLVKYSKTADDLLRQVNVLTQQLYAAGDDLGKAEDIIRRRTDTEALSTHLGRLIEATRKEYKAAEIVERQEALAAAKVAYTSYYEKTIDPTIQKLWKELQQLETLAAPIRANGGDPPGLFDWQFLQGMNIQRERAANLAALLKAPR